MTAYARLARLYPQVYEVEDRVAEAAEAPDPLGSILRSWAAREPGDLLPLSWAHEPHVMFVDLVLDRPRSARGRRVHLMLTEAEATDLLRELRHVLARWRSQPAEPRSQP